MGGLGNRESHVQRLALPLTMHRLRGPGHHRALTSSGVCPSDQRGPWQSRCLWAGPPPHLPALPLWPQTLQNEILGHAPRVEDVLQRGRQLLEAAEIDCQDIQERLGHLQGAWDALQEAAAGRLQRLRDASEAQQYYLDAGEAEAWISEQEFYIISDEIPKVGPGWGTGARLGAKARRKSRGGAGSGQSRIGSRGV